MTSFTTPLDILAAINTSAEAHGWKRDLEEMPESERNAYDTHGARLTLTRGLSIVEIELTWSPETGYGMYIGDANSEEGHDVFGQERPGANATGSYETRYDVSMDDAQVEACIAHHIAETLVPLVTGGVQ